MSKKRIVGALFIALAGFAVACGSSGTDFSGGFGGLSGIGNLAGGGGGLALCGCCGNPRQSALGRNMV